MAFFHYPNGKLTQTAKTNENKPWKIKKPKRKFTRARHCRCHCFISQKFRTNRGALKANEPQASPSLSPLLNLILLQSMGQRNLNASITLAY